MIQNPLAMLWAIDEDILFQYFVQVIFIKTGRDTAIIWSTYLYFSQFLLVKPTFLSFLVVVGPFLSAKCSKKLAKLDL